MPRICSKLPAKEARIGSAHERLWNFLPAKAAPEIFVAHSIARQSIRVEENEVKRKKIYAQRIENAGKTSCRNIAEFVRTIFLAAGGLPRALIIALPRDDG